MALGELFNHFHGKPARESSARALFDGLREAGDLAESRYDPDEDRILRLGNGKPCGAINLGNISLISLAAPPTEHPE